MKLITFEKDKNFHIGAVLPGEKTISDFTAASEAPHFRDMLALIDGGERALDEARLLAENPKVAHSLVDVRLKAPVPVPRQMFDCACFEEHLIGCLKNGHIVSDDPPPLHAHEGPEPPLYRQFPLYYKCNRFSVSAHNDDIICPRYSTKLDYELEFGVFLSRSGKNITVAEAEDYIFGYCIFNDVSARDQQFREMRGMLGPTKSKDFDTGNVMGPWLVTADEVPSPQNLTMKVFINGNEVSSGTSADMLHTFPEIIAYTSQDETRHAGEFFASGTVGGGSGLETGRLLQHGDIVELEVSGLGRLRNRVVFQDQLT